MDNPVIYSVIGVVVGWGLSEYSAYKKLKLSQKECINRIIAKLVYIRDKAVTFNSAHSSLLAIIKDAADKEEIRHNFIIKHGAHNFKKDLIDTLDTLSAYDTELAIQINRRMSIIFDTPIRLRSLTSKPELFDKFTEGLEGVTNSVIRYLENAILKLSFRVSLIQWIRMHKLLQISLWSSLTRNKKCLKVDENRIFSLAEGLFYQTNMATIMQESTNKKNS